MEHILKGEESNIIEFIFKEDNWGEKWLYYSKKLLTKQKKAFLEWKQIFRMHSQSTWEGQEELPNPEI